MAWIFCVRHWGQAQAVGQRWQRGAAHPSSVQRTLLGPVPPFSALLLQKLYLDEVVRQHAVEERRETDVYKIFEKMHARFGSALPPLNITQWQDQVSKSRRRLKDTGAVEQSRASKGGGGR